MKTLTVMLAAVAATLALGASKAGAEGDYRRLGEHPAGDSTIKTKIEQMSEEEAVKMYQEAVALTKSGDLAGAIKICEELLLARPGHRPAARFLSETRGKLREQERPGGIRDRLRHLVLPELSLRDAVARDTMDYLQRLSGELSEDKKPINFVWMVPPEAPLGRVTLNLRNIPLEDALRYVTQVSGLRYRVETHAVVISLPERAAAVAPDPNAKPQ